ncbi:MAG TPA: hypothetical protein PK031_08120 [Pseudomonadales bacterium]|nr:hypothetical protein [Pseudomonadales bacterium]
MRAWKKVTVSCCVLLAFNALVQADESSGNTEKKQKHMVDMADGLNSQQFMDSKNPDALWSSTMFVPWLRTGAINAYKDTGKDIGKDGINAYKEESLAMPAKSSGETGVSETTTGFVEGKKIESDQLVNIRVMYGLDPEHTKTSFTPASSQNELFRQMSKYCRFGFQKVGEWSELVEGSDYYLYYQFQCIDKH